MLSGFKVMEVLAFCCYSDELPYILPFKTTQTSDSIVLWDGPPTLTALTKIKVLVWLSPSLETRKKNSLVASRSFFSPILYAAYIPCSWPLPPLQSQHLSAS